MNLNHTTANQIIETIVAEFVKINKSGIVAVADGHGELLAFLRMDGAKLSSINLVINKAWTAARTQKTTLETGAAVKEKGYDISYYGDAKFTGFGGGVPVFQDGIVIGAVAVSGLSQEEDEELALYGIAQVLK
jgi:glc operon protein GlcG